MITLISAYTKRHRIIGKNGCIPWKIPEEMNHFKETTMGGALIFGRKTIEEIGKALPGRFNLGLSQTNLINLQNVVTAHSLTEAVKMCHSQGYEKIFICGGEKVYRQALAEKLPEKLILSEIDEAYCQNLSDADAFFPEIPECYIETKRTVNEKFTVLEFTRKDCLC